MQALAQVADWPVDTAAVAVVRRDGSVAGMHGPADHAFALASVTKPLVSYAVLVALEEGAVGLDQPAGPPGSTVRHLLAHASGLAPDEPRAAAAVGSRRIYSNAGFDVLGEHVEAATAMSVADYLAEAVVAPLGMSNTVLNGSPAHGATSSLSDMIAFAAEVQNPRLVHPDTVRQASSVVFPGLVGVLPGYGRQDPNDWGLGFEIRDGKSPHWTGLQSSPGTFGHFGRSGTFLWIDPAAGLACICLTDRDFADWAIQAWPQLTDAILSEAGGAAEARTL